jgi:parallel beta-helix repeat protein
MIELDGTSAGSNVSGFTFDGDDITVRGLTINRFDFDGISVNGENNIIAGNYIGTNISGAADLGNQMRGVGSGGGTSDGLLIGGLNPEDRNVIAGNDDTGISPTDGSDNWTVQGNYVGLGSDGSTAVPNAQANGSGALSLDDGDGHTVGGSADGAQNVISGNNSYGIAPHVCNSCTIEGNLIGVLPDGVTPAPNGGPSGYAPGINWSQSSNVAIRDNIVSYNENGPGLAVSNATGGTIQGNTVTNNVDGPGIMVVGSTNVLVGGTTDAQKNMVHDNGAPGIGVASMNITNVPMTIASSGVSVLRNEVYDNDGGTMFGLPTDGLGIDLFSIDLNGNTPTGLEDEGVTPNDAGDTDPGPNYFQNFPVITGISSDGDDVTFTYNLDVNPADPNVNGYRVEFFANTTADPSGHGQGQTYLGADAGLTGDVTGRTFTVSNTALANGSYSFAAVTTATDNSADGFGSSSEFSADLAATISPASSNGSGAGAGTLADTGLDTYVYLALAGGLVLTGGLVWRRLVS